MDMQKWTAYALEDTYHRDSHIEDYPVDGYEVPRDDPIAGSSLCLEEPILGPREYFLSLVKERLEEYQAELDRTVTEIIRRAEK